MTKKKAVEETARWYDTHCTICSLEFVDGECPPDCPAEAETSDGAEWHGTAGGYSNRKCRGPLCRRAHADAAQAEKEQRAKTPFDKIPHGINGYTNYRCRCDVCRTANTEAKRRRRHQAR